MNQHESLETLPTELLLEIVRYLDGQDLGRVRLASSALAKVGRTILIDRVRLKRSIHSNPFLGHFRRPKGLTAFCNKLATLKYFPPRVCIAVTELTIEPLPRLGNESLEDTLGSFCLPALQKITLHKLRTQSTVPLIRLVEAHAQTLTSFQLFEHVIEQGDVPIEYFGIGVGLRTAWKPFFQAVSSMLDRPLKLTSMTLHALDVALWDGTSARDTYPLLRLVTSHAAFQKRRNKGSVSAKRPTITLTESEEPLQRFKKGGSPQNIKILGQQAVRRGLEMLSAGSEKCLWEGRDGQP